MCKYATNGDYLKNGNIGKVLINKGFCFDYLVSFYGSLVLKIIFSGGMYQF